MFARQANNHLLDDLAQRWSAERSLPAIRPLPTQQFAMPLENGFRREEHQTLAHARARRGWQRAQLTHQHRQAQLLPPGEPGWPRLGALQHGELAAKQQDLELLVAVRLEAQRAEINEPREQASEHIADHLPSDWCRFCAQRSKAKDAPTQEKQARSRLVALGLHYRTLHPAADQRLSPVLHLPGIFTTAMIDHDYRKEDGM
jgi:hypothetical protein